MVRGNGKLVVFEGISGTGKETQAKLLKEYLDKRGITARIVFHPSPELKEVLRAWRKQRSIDHVSEAYFLMADRYDRVRQVINPALKKGEWIISLRSSLSALVYQAKIMLERRWIANEFGRFEPIPDALFFFDISALAAMARITKRHEATGELLGKFETQEHLVDKRLRYQQVMQTIPHHLINAADTIDAIHAHIISSINFTM